MAITGWLHTASEFNTEVFSIPNSENLRQQSESYLAESEKELYSWVGESTYEGFRNKLRKLFNESDDIRKALQNIRGTDITINLGLPDTVKFVEEEIQVTLISNQSDDIGAYMVGALNSLPGVKASGNNLTFTFEYNETNIKNFLNAYLKQNRFKDNSKNKRSEKTNPLRYANKEFRHLLETDQLGELKINGKPVNKSLIVGATGISNNFQYTAADIKKAINDKSKEGQALRQAILNSRNIIHDTLRNFMNGISDLEKAFDIAWNEKMGNSKNQDVLLEKFSFFAKGDNLTAGVKGAVQELFTAIIAEYVNIKIGKGIYPKVAEVLGNVAKGGEMPKSDVEILQRIGIQVKAYRFDKDVLFMTSNIHPDTLQAALPVGTNVADAIVQAVFNKDSGDYNALADKLEPLLAQLMSMKTADNLTDKICFYFVDGQYLVPGSYILEQLRVQGYQIKIRTSFETLSDAYFEEKTDGKENFLKYFNGPRASLHSHFTKDNVTNENFKLYNLLLNKSVSIDVKFDYSFMGSSAYTIY